MISEALKAVDCKVVDVSGGCGQSFSISMEAVSLSLYVCIHISLSIYIV